MPQKRITLKLSEDQKQELTDFIQKAPNERLGIRASMVLDCAAGMKVYDVAAKYGERPNTVVLWKRRYAENGIKGLENLPRGKSKDGYGPDFTERLVAAVHSAPPDGEREWTIALLAKHFDVPEYGIRRHLKKAGIYLEADAFLEEHLSNSAESDSNKTETHPTATVSTADDSSQLPECNETTHNEPMPSAEAKSSKLTSTLYHVLRDEKGNIVQIAEADAGMIPDQHSFNMSSVAGFRGDYALLEQGMINAFVNLLGNSSESFLAKASAELLKKKQELNLSMPTSVHRVNAEFASFDVLTMGKMSSELKPNQAIESEAFELLKLTTATGCAFEVAARHLNTLQHRREGSEVQYRQLQYQVTRTGKCMRLKQVTDANTILDANGFDTTTLLLRPGVTLDFIQKPIIGAYTSLDERVKRFQPAIAAYNKGRLSEDTMINRLNLIWKTEGCPRNVMYFFLDEIGVDHQVEHRWVGERPPLQPIRSSAWVENTVAYVLMNGKHFFLTAPDMKEMMRLILAFALEHGLKEGAELVFFSDGANNIKTAIETYFSFYPFVLYLDWFHLTKRIKEDGSRAFGGTIEEKKKYYKEIFNRLWPGNLDAAKSYMETLPIRNKAMYDKLIAYLDRKSPYLCSYALRKELGYCNASSAVEKANDLLIARRQKHNGMSWSYLGSGSLAIITATLYNGRLAEYVHDGTLLFDWAEDDGEEDLAA